MHARNSIRRRIVLILAMTLALAGLLLGSLLLGVYRHLESDTFGRMVQEHLRLLLEQPQSVLGAQGEQNALFSRWQVFRAAAPEALPPPLDTLGPGAHHSVRLGEHRYQVEIAAHDQGVVALAYRITDWERQEHTLFVVAVLAVLATLALALLLGSRVAGAILQPVHRLTERLAEIRPGQPVQPFSGEFQHSELAPIAASLDNYLRRLEQFVEREQSFSAAASHELRTPLSVVVGALDVIESHPGSEAAARATERIRRACGEMVGFIDATLFLSREAAVPRDADVTVDVAEVVRALIEDYAPVLREAQITVAVSLQPTPLSGVPVSLLQIAVGNLLKNVAEHSGATRAQLSLEAHCLELQDNGRGIDPAHLPHVFERSFSTGAHGNGMGLSLLKRIADRFGWQLGIDSQPGAGVRARIDFRPGSE